MAERALSEHEVEAVIAALAAEDETPTSIARRISELDRPVRLYDFRRPEKFAPQHLSALRSIHETFARGLSRALTSHVRSHARARLTAIEPLPYGEWLAALPRETAIYPVTLAPLPGRAAIAIDLALARLILDRRLGSSGPHGLRLAELTEIELDLLRMFGDLLGERLREAWAEVLAVQPAVLDPVLVPARVQVTPPSEIVVGAMHELELLNAKGVLSVCLPHPLLQPGLEQLGGPIQSDAASRAGQPQQPAVVPGEGLGQVTLPVVVELGRTEVSLRELLSLANGHVIRLDTPADGSLPIRIGEQVKFSGRPGVIGRNLGVHVTGRGEVS